VPTCPVRSQAGLWRRTAPMAKEADGTNYE
jgi:hypothetical protein